jgi:SH3-like domain-containing protein
MTTRQYVALRAELNKRIGVAQKHMIEWRKKGYSNLGMYFEIIKDDLERRRDQIDAQFIWKQ